MGRRFNTIAKKNHLYNHFVNTGLTDFSCRDSPKDRDHGDFFESERYFDGIHRLTITTAIPEPADAAEASSIGDIDVASISRLHELQHLTLHNQTDMHSWGAEHLTELTNLQTLRLTGSNDISEATLMRVRDGLPNCEMTV